MDDKTFGASVKRVWERRDLDHEEKAILVDLLMRQPDPEKSRDEVGPFPVTTVVQHKAIVPATDIADRTGLSERTVRDRIGKLQRRGFIEKISGKGRTGNRYLVKFPKRATQNKA